MSDRVYRLIVVIGALVSAVALVCSFGGPGARAAVSQTIHAYFDADGNLMFTYLDGTQVEGSIPPGTYQVVYDNFGADDVAVDHAFHLFGPGIDFAPAAAVVHSTFNVSFQTSAAYTLQDDLHPAIGRRVFVATTAGGSASSGGSSSGGSSSGGSSSGAKSTTKPVSNDVVGSAIKPFRGALAGTVSSAGKLTLLFKGKGVGILKSGRYKLAVQDKSSKSAFMIQRVKKSPVTVSSQAFVGRRVVTVTLDAGQWWFFSGTKKKYFVVVS